MTVRRRSFAGTFLVTLILTLGVLGCAASFFMIECNIRRTAYGRAEFAYAFMLDGGRPVLIATDGTPLVLLSAADEERWAPLVGAPWRLLWRWGQVESDAVSRVMEALCRKTGF